jgi:hypothetical protein
MAREEFVAASSICGSRSLRFSRRLQSAPTKLTRDWGEGEMGAAGWVLRLRPFRSDKQLRQVEPEPTRGRAGGPLGPCAYPPGAATITIPRRLYRGKGADDSLGMRTGPMYKASVGVHVAYPITSLWAARHFASAGSCAHRRLCLSRGGTCSGAVATSVDSQALEDARRSSSRRRHHEDVLGTLSGSSIAHIGNDNDCRPVASWRVA